MFRHYKREASGPAQDETSTLVTEFSWNMKKSNAITDLWGGFQKP